MKLIVKKGRTSLLVRIFIQDSSSTTGAGLSGLTNASAGLVCYRARDDDGNAAATQVALSAGTRGTWSSGGFVEKDATNMKGVYELGLPDAGQATGSETVTYYLAGATNMAPLALEIQLVAYDPQDAAALGLSRVDAAVSSRMATFTLPTNFSSLAIDVSGDVTYNNAAPPSAATIAGQVLTTALTESYAALHAAPTLAQITFEIRGLLAEKAVAGTTLTTKKLDGSTTAATFTLNDATAPTSITRAS